jgi:hypothetical protein
VQLLPAHFQKRGVDGADQVTLGIDERAVEVENERADGGKFRGSHEHSLYYARAFSIVIKFKSNFHEKLMLELFRDSREFA